MSEILKRCLPGSAASELPPSPAAAQADGGSIWWAVAIAAVVTLISFAVNAHLDVSLWDEGFLWYGVQQTYDGSIPFRDFQSYDPGRYYWSAAIMRLLGDDGIISLRLAIAAAQWIGLAMVGWLVGQQTRSVPWVVLVVVLAAIWMFPRHKIFDITASIILVATTSLLLERRLNRYYFLGGVAVGVSALVGRNHGAYGALAQFVAVAVAVFGSPLPTALRAFGNWGLGVIAGYTPMLLMMVLARGFLTAFLENLAFILNLPVELYSVPVPWAWQMDSGQFDARLMKEAGLGLLFMLMILYPPLVVVYTLARQVPDRYRPILWSTAGLCLVYSHHALSRADISHLAQSIMPLSIGIGVLAMVTVGRNSSIRKLGFAAFAVVSVLVALPEHPWYRSVTAQNWQPITLGADRLLVPPEVANEINWLQRLKAEYLKPGQSIYVTPLWPGAYSVLGLRAPNYEIYALYPRDRHFQEQEYSRLESSDVGVVILTDRPVDQNESQRFQLTHPLLYQFVVDNFAPLDVERPYPWLNVFRVINQ